MLFLLKGIIEKMDFLKKIPLKSLVHFLIILPEQNLIMKLQILEFIIKKSLSQF
jgi:hypothetical protein